MEPVVARQPAQEQNAQMVWPAGQEDQVPVVVCPGVPGVDKVAVAQAAVQECQALVFAQPAVPTDRTPVVVVV